MVLRRGLVTWLAVAALIAGACTGAATPQPVPSAAATAASTPTTDGTLPKPELSSIKIAATVAEISQFSTKLAERVGLYEKYGVKAEVVTLNADADVVSTFLSGQADMGVTGTAAMLNSQLTDNPGKVIAIEKVKVFDGLFCGKDITTPEQVKGKQIAVSSLGSAAHASVLLALEAMKISPKDVTVTPVGGQSARIAALKAGSISCAPVSMDQKATLSPLGLNVVVDLSTTDLQYPASALSALVSWLQKNPNTALAVAAAHLEAQEYMLSKPSETANLWAEYAQIPVATATTLVQGLPPVLNRSMRWTDSAFTFSQQVVSVVQPSITIVDPTKAYDRSYLQKLEDIGFYKKLGIPTS
jgi:ABC-type nitrate/sulfonate/bicarbonate transport system substrate-binding protein